ncbi:nitrile hydratase accessory protein [Acuticoccus sp. MNP-M23]|uniref:nitrile hydratase accessory protein n=1 Tax=Acuticoccus sp. MNP-M23 TaxID=3072793 RepID=UPI002816241B|nr:nitrile hydratase accessory protein [Acuticoccus sp. MNP-M23]WMS41095.1 nitrile hydratase accessory protein [Acuticoccus sp. MNP-M23]
MPSEADEPTFAAPWEATAFALKAHLVETGKLDAGDFAAHLGAALRENPAPADDGTAYFVAFVTALERAIAPLAPADALAAEIDAWHSAAAATPHGEPIELPQKATAR